MLRAMERTEDEERGGALYMLLAVVCKPSGNVWCILRCSLCVQIALFSLLQDAAERSKHVWL